MHTASSSLLQIHRPSISREKVFNYRPAYIYRYITPRRLGINRCFIYSLEFTHSRRTELTCTVSSIFYTIRMGLEFVQFILGLISRKYVIHTRRSTERREIRGRISLYPNSKKNYRIMKKQKKFPVDISIPIKLIAGSVPTPMSFLRQITNVLHKLGCWLYTYSQFDSTFSCWTGLETNIKFGCEACSKRSKKYNITDNRLFQFSDNRRIPTILIL